MRHIARLIGTLLGLAAPAAAHGAASQQINSSTDFGGMWGRICTTLPFCDRGVGIIGDIGEAVINTALPVLAAAAIASIVYAGIKMIMSQGDESGYSDAKKIVMTTLVGSFIALAALGIIQYFYNSLLPAAT